jgi:hypothetical protein
MSQVHRSEMFSFFVENLARPARRAAKAPQRQPADLIAELENCAVALAQAAVALNATQPILARLFGCAAVRVRDTVARARVGL